MVCCKVHDSGCSLDSSCRRPVWVPIWLPLCFSGEFTPKHIIIGSSDSCILVNQNVSFVARTPRAMPLPTPLEIQSPFSPLRWLFSRCLGRDFTNQPDLLCSSTVPLLLVFTMCCPSGTWIIICLFFCVTIPASAQLSHTPFSSAHGALPMFFLTVPELPTPRVLPLWPTGQLLFIKPADFEWVSSAELEPLVGRSLLSYSACSSLDNPCALGMGFTRLVLTQHLTTWGTALPFSIQLC